MDSRSYLYYKNQRKIVVRLQTAPLPMHDSRASSTEARAQRGWGDISNNANLSVQIPDAWCFRKFAGLFSLSDSSFFHRKSCLFALQVIKPSQKMVTNRYYYFITGYSTHIVGKWHLGFFKWPYTPTYRGFDSFYGLYTGQADHYTYVNRGFRDLHDNKKPVKNKRGVYSTRLFAKVIYPFYI